jgi:hypothetical protein
MATVNDALRTALGQVLSDTFDTGTGVLEIGDAGFANTLASWDINATQTTGVTTGVWTVDFDSNDATVAAPGGTASVWRIRESGTPTYEITGAAGSVLTSGGDINFDSVTWTTGQTATLSSMTFTVPAATA